MKIDDVVLGRSRYRPTGPLVAFGAREAPPSIHFNPFMPRRTTLHPPSARGDPGSDMAGMAMDEQVIEVAASWAGVAYASAFAEGVTFLGYAYLSELAQRPEYRAIVGTIAEEMTRKGFKLVAKGTDDKADKISALDDELKRLKVIDVLREANEQDGFFGRSHIYLDTGDTENREELKIPLGTGWDQISLAKVSPQRPLQRLVTVEPVWVYPTNYNSNDPLRRDWYRPQYWFVQSKELHVSRLLTFVGREVPDLLKPAYSFGGLALTQMVKPYVDNWLRTRQSVADLIHAFSVFVLSTDLQSTLQNGGDELFRRLTLFTNFRDNRGLMVTNKETEELQNVSAPLGTLDVLQAQTQEQMAAVSRIPLVKLLGIQPAGLNASSEGEIRTFYDTIAAMQEKFFNDNLHRIIGFAMLSLWGRVDPDITFEWESLWALDEKGEAEVRKINAETGAVHINAGVIDPAEERERVAREPGTPYQNLDINDVPEPPQEEDTGEGTGGEGGEVDVGTGPSDGSEEKKESSGAADAAPRPFAFDAWSESDHPRGQPGNPGQFGPGGGGESAGAATKGQVSAVKAYTSSPAYKQINAALRGGQKPSEATQNLINEMDGYLTKSGPLQDATKTYRGIGGEAAKALISKGLKPGDRFIDPGFASTSAIESIAETDVITGARSDILMEIDLPRGARAADISAISGDDEEGEILLGRGTEFVVTSFDPKSGRLKVEALAPAAISASGEGRAPFKPGIKVTGMVAAEAQKRAWQADQPQGVDAITAAAEKNQKLLADACAEAAAAVGIPFTNPGPKSRARIQEKVEHGKAVNDAVRGGFDVQTPEQGEAILKQLATKFELADEGWTKTPAGYFDRKTMVRFPDGQVGELQMWPPGMLAAKEEKGHKLYAEWQGLKEPPPSPHKGALLDAMVAIYGAVQAALPVDWSAIIK